MRIENVTFCMGYWHVPENVKNDLDHYLYYLPKTLEMISNGKIIFFFESEEILIFVKNIAVRFSIAIEYVYMPIKNLPTYKQSIRFLDACKRQDNRLLARSCDKQELEKGLVHFNREYSRSGEDAYKKVISIWTSKLPLLEHMIEENPYKTDNFSWIDASLARMNGERDKSNFTQNIPDSPEAIYIYPSCMTYWGKKIDTSAGFLFGSSKLFDKLFQHYDKELEACLSESYAHDEETILQRVYDSRPNLFNKIT